MMPKDCHRTPERVAEAKKALKLIRAFQVATKCNMPATAAYIGVPFPTLRQWLRGDASPTMENCAIVMKAFATPVTKERVRAAKQATRHEAWREYHEWMKERGPGARLALAKALGTEPFRVDRWLSVEPDKAPADLAERVRAFIAAHPRIDLAARLDEWKRRTGEPWSTFAALAGVNTTTLYTISRRDNGRASYENEERILATLLRLEQKGDPEP